MPYAAWARRVFIFSALPHAMSSAAIATSTSSSTTIAVRISLIDLVAIKQFLEDELNVEVDVTTRDSLHPMLKADIEQSAIRVF